MVVRAASRLIPSGESHRKGEMRFPDGGDLRSLLEKVETVRAAFAANPRRKGAEDAQNHADIR